MQQNIFPNYLIMLLHSKFNCFLLFTLFFTLNIQVKGEVNTGDTIFRMDTIHEIRLTFSEKDNWDTLENRYNRFHDIDSLDRFMAMATIEIDGVSVDSVGVKLKGNYTYSISTGKKPMKIDFNAFVKGKRYEGLRALNLSNEFPDPSMLRNTVGYKILRDAGLIVPRTSFAKVFVNDVYKGLYSVIEQIDKSYLRMHFKDGEGELIKGVASSLFWLPDDTLSFWRNFEIKNKNTPETWSRLIAFAKKINTTPAEVFYDSLSTEFDFDSYIPVFAADVIFNNWDSYFFGQNYYIYKDSTEGRYHFLAWDYNNALNNQEGKEDFQILPGGSNNYLLSLPLPVKILNNKKLRSKYFDELCSINKIMASDSIKTFILKMHNLIRPALLKDTGKEMTIQQYDESLHKFISLSDIGFSGLLNFIHYRNIQVNNMLNKAGHSCENSGNKK